MKFPFLTRHREAQNRSAVINGADEPSPTGRADDTSYAVGAKYSGMPNRLYLIDTDGRIAFKNGRGPFGFHPQELEQPIILLLAEEALVTTE